MKTINYLGISKDSKQFKGNIHSHTTNSDGFLSPIDAKEFYKANGYDFIAFTDHELYSDYRAELDDENFIILPGIEASTNLVCDGQRIKTHHVVGLLGTKDIQKNAKKPLFKHLESVVPFIKFESWNGLAAAQELVDSLHERGLIVHYAHPRWSRVNYEEFANLINIYGIEIYTYASELECGLGDSSLYWDNILLSNRNLLGIACDDNHNEPKLPNSFGGAIAVCADSLCHEEIIKNIISGNYYSTSGVDIIEWGVQNNEVHVTCSDVNRINFIVGGKVTDGETIFCKNLEDTINSASYTLRGSESYVRIECVDKYGRKAWTNPYFIK